jgi:hypothetical protein
MANRANPRIAGGSIQDPSASNISSSNFGVLAQVLTPNNVGNRTGQVALRLDF